MSDASWMADANCIGTDPEAFFPESGDRPGSMVHRVCANCPVQAECLAYALENDERGIWGGTGERQRHRMPGYKPAPPPPEACRNGHTRTPENTHIRPNGARMCTICRAAQKQAWVARNERDANVA